MNYYYKKYARDNIEVVEMGNELLNVKIAPKEGNNLFSYNVNGTEVLSYDDTLPLASFLTGNPLLFPFPNRIEDAIWIWDGKSHIHKKDGVPRQLHSMIYDEKSWSYSEPIISDEGILLETVLRVDENHAIYKGYPFEFELKIIYILQSEGISLKYELENKSEKSMPYGFAIHPYFKRVDGDDNTFIHLPCDYYYESKTDVEQIYFSYTGKEFTMIPNILPTGRLIETKGSVADVNHPVAVGDLDLDHVFTSKKHIPESVIHYAKQNLKIKIGASDEFTHYVLYAPPNKPFFCIEPQTCSTNAVNLYHKGHENCNLLILDKKSSTSGEIYIKYELI